jgi:hypothetical protein
MTMFLVAYALGICGNTTDAEPATKGLLELSSPNSL